LQIPHLPALEFVPFEPACLFIWTSLDLFSPFPVV
jgi:hypothetical protein